MPSQRGPSACGCIFCGKTPTTNAHVYRKAWIDEISPLSAGFRHRRGSLAHLPGAGKSEWVKDVIDLKVNAACAGCNGGWMNDLDHAAEEAFLTHAVLGFDVRLSSLREKKTVARWCGLVGSLMDQATRAPSLPQRVRDAIRDDNVPEDMQAWIFRTEPPEDRDVIWGGTRHFTLTARGRATGRITTHDIYFATFGIKQLVVHLAQPTGPLQPENRLLRGGPQAIVRQLWPPPRTPLIWPPAETLPWEAALAMPDEIARQTTG